MRKLDSFAPIVSKQAKILILGTMPGTASLQKQQYYGHPRNAFWPIMEALFAINPELCYRDRKAKLTENGIAVWDVLLSCNRRGSLDSQIEKTSIRVNNFADFFTEYNHIKHVFFNGALAESLYRKNSLPTLGNRFSYLHYRRLPSTSPAHASLTVAQKVQAWSVVAQLTQTNNC